MLILKLSDIVCLYHYQKNLQVCIENLTKGVWHNTTLSFTIFMPRITAWSIRNYVKLLCFIDINDQWHHL